MVQASPPPFSFLSSVSVITLVVVLVLSTLFLLARWKADMRGGSSSCEQRNKQHHAGPACPVVITDQKEFRGNHICLGIGRHAQVSADDGSGKGAFAFTDGIQSLEVRRGYRAVAYEGPRFTGRKILEKVGPATYQETRTNATTPFPNSVIVSLDRN